MNIRILVADDHQLYAEALTVTLRRERDFEVVATVDDSREVVAAALRTLPRVVVLGVSSHSAEWLRRIGELRTRLPDCGIALIAARPTRAQVEQAVEAGVSGIVPQYARLPYLHGAIRDVAAGRTSVDRGLLGTSGPGNRPLSDREVEILQLTATGASIKEIAGELYLAAGTVRNLASTAIKKLEGRNRFDAARIAGERGWL
jgi:two-component system response regulator DesR